VVLLTVLLDTPILGLFLPRDGGSITIAAHINLLASWSFMVMGVTMILSSITRANGATFVPLVIMVLAYVPGRLGVALALTPRLGIEALWWSFPISAAVSLLLTIAYYFWGGWRQISLLATMEEAEEFVQSESDPAGRLLPNG
jgi:Na+-driven multidrug efflux pump